ncbi:MAG: TauD/TfdA family dioxygenase [Acidimicrobiales bacterium]|nr:TauD/TfdA family dioxygenase [Acidimicrobiales bacterium]
MTATLELDLEPVTGTIGATVRGIDLGAPLDDATISALRGALVRYGVLFFRDQQLSRDQHVAFGRRFGELHVHPFVPNLGPDHPEIIELTTSGMTRFLDWHSDATFEELPPLGSILYAHEVPEAGGDTLFTSAVAAYDALSATMQELLDGLRAFHDSTPSFGAGGVSERWTRSGDADQTLTSHPVVRTHPESGRKAIFVNSIFTTGIVGMNPDESAALLRFLIGHVSHPMFQVRFRWEPNSVAFWDNRAVQHAAVADFAGSGAVRRMHRVTVIGDRPV